MEPSCSPLPAPAIGLATMLVLVAMTGNVSAVPARVGIAALEPGNFTYAAGGPDLPGGNPTGLSVSGMTVYQFPALEGQGVAMFVADFDACTINLPHIHPRATEMVYMLKGKLRSAFVEEAGGTRGAIVNDISAGDSTFYPQGLVHYQQNLECEGATFVAAVNSEDPGTVYVVPSFFALPDDAVEGTAGIELDNPAVAALVEGLPDAPARARQECLMRCNLLPADDDEEEDDDEDEDFSMSYTDTYDDEGQGTGGRMLRG